MNKWQSFLYTVFGTLVTAFAISTLLTPNAIVCGGVSGVSTILYQTFRFAPGVTFAVINVVLLVAGIAVLGKHFVLKTLLGAGLLSGFVQLFSYIPPITDNPFLATVFGGVLYAQVLDQVLYGSEDGSLLVDLGRYVVDVAAA